ncbi:MAG: cytidylate kinase-like family protein [Marinilabiliales bacterium]|nr:cytidylate kinase-like family protein [Marinilabiliales bacterium]
MNKIFDYFDTRYRAEMLGRPVDQTGPVITISRLTGCDGREVAAELVAQLNLRYKTNRWKWIDKDIIYHAAHELKTDTQRVETYYQGLGMTDFSQMIMAFSGSYVTDSSVKKAIREVVLSIARDGYAVIIGRGGVAITSGMANALHVRLMAPIYWRVQNVMKKKGMIIEKAEEYVIQTDEKRHKLIVDFLDKKTQSIDYLFDVTLNRSSFTLEQISSLIMTMYETKLGIKLK